jgi:protein-S-isoprenylcysteine O-methyltransferase Ste14
MSFLNIFLLILVVFLWGFVHSVTASLPFKAFIRRVFGPASDRWYRLVYNAVAVVTFIGVLVVAALTQDTTLYIVPFPWVALLIIVEFLVVAALIIGLMQTDPLNFLGLRQFSGEKRKQGSKLVTDGLYHYVRHPLYTAGLIFIWALPLMTARLLVLNLALTVYVIAGAFYEERKLKQKFGVEYVRYSAITPMFIPFTKKVRPGSSPADFHGKV